MEYFDIVDENGNNTGQVASREEAHRLGLWHRNSHIWIVNSANEILTQLRAVNLDANPGLFDCSAAGHVSAGDTDLDSAVRETEERETGKN
jgi:isopentenyldiphosphate isomerase